MFINAQKRDGQFARKRQAVAHLRPIRREKGFLGWFGDCAHACAAGAKVPRQQIYRLYFILPAGFEDVVIVAREGNLLQSRPSRRAAEMVPGTGIEPVRTFRPSGF